MKYKLLIVLLFIYSMAFGSGAPLGRKSHTMSTSLGYGIDTSGRSVMLGDFSYNYKSYDFGLHENINVNDPIWGTSFYVGKYCGYWKYSLGIGNVHQSPIQGQRYFSMYYSIKYLPVKYFYIDFEHHLMFDFGYPMKNEIIIGTGFSFPFIFW